MLTTFSAILSAISSPSIAQGPANKKKLFASKFFMLGTNDKSITKFLTKVQNKCC
jgi:hypothetical protein